ncbi:hypothetical protein [Sphingopyxis sp. RIFCSPHIGHO2_12_FULL_65_19]|uniref:hypothetical protein n=1 Tax=Sphingopyxis sp. RIFCSPHIGHO2_12_FULL_65_19 TaxID=1802172 RepID=UPI0008D11A5D|nr:hypothetical protein [Sphingopyxis sp. RIFCSPHIGHO2_12_FULL_65_19]OHD07101.1 MAG: hypothetical protein A3E77_15275 [Sphingopyxis sp. RIFCSPHIGHO2_12_FULL_65_19]
MINRKMGQAGRAASPPLIALALLLAGVVPAFSQETTTSRPLDFRLPPAEDDNRTPGVQGPSDNGLPPVAPGERRGQPTPAPTPAPTPVQPATPPRVIPTQPATVTTPAPTATQRDTPATPRPVPSVPAPSAPSDATDNPTLPPLEATTPATPTAPGTTSERPIAADKAPVAAGPTSPSSGTPLWAWLLALLAALGAGYWYWRRRAALAGPPIDEVQDVPRAVTPRPTATPPPPRAAAAPPTVPPASRPAAPRPAAPQPLPPPTVPSEARAASPLVTRPAGEKRAVISMALHIRSIRFAADHVAVGFALNLLNQGTVAATGLMVRIALNQGSAMPEPVLSRFFDGAGGSVLRDDMVLAPGAGEELSTEVMLPRAAIEPLMIGGKPMLVPVIAFDVTYHWDGDGDAFGQNAGSFVLGREQGASGSEKLAPLPLDRLAYAVDRPGARATAIKRAQ